jgi:hypothetical protein
MSEDNKILLLKLESDHAVMLWWCLYEKTLQLDCRLKQFQHTTWPAEAKNAAQWELNVLKTIRDNLEKLA